MRLIDADALMVRLVRKTAGTANKRYTDGFNDALMKFRSMISTAPTIEAEPVKHGRWVTGDELNTPRKLLVTHFLYCSECGEEAYWDTDYGQQKFDYCPNCGAKMCGGADHEGS